MSASASCSDNSRTIEASTFKCAHPFALEVPHPTKTDGRPVNTLLPLAALIVCTALFLGCAKSAPAPTGPQDYTVVAKNLYMPVVNTGADGRVGFYVTVVIGGVARETSLFTGGTIVPTKPPACFTGAKLGEVLAESCR